jgi:phage terminase large subunit
VGKSIYDSKIKCRMAEIEEWAVMGETKKEVAKRLGINYSTFRTKIRQLGISHFWENKYEALVLPKIDDIKEWVEEGRHIYVIAQKLGVSEQSLLNYRNKYKELDNCFINALKSRRSKLETARINEALGYWAGRTWCRPNIDLNRDLINQIDSKIEARQEAEKPRDISKYLVLPSFKECWETEDRYTHIVKKGGRNTGKTVQEALKFIWRRMYTKTSGLVVRRFFNSIRNSIFQDLVYAIYLMEVEKHWEWTQGQTGALYMRCKYSGAEIFFRGADKADRTKGIKSKLPISDLLIEEAAEFQKEEDLSTIINSVYRAKLPGNLRYRFSMLYNPPKRKGHWLNKKYETTKPLKDTYIHHSVIWDNAYMSRQQRDEIKELKKDNYQRYLWEFKGKPIGGGLVPFSKMTFRTITDAEIKFFDNIRVGVDWGYSNNILAVPKLHLDQTRKKMYFIDEIQGLKMSNDTLIKKLFEKGFDKYLILCDSASPKDIADLKDAGLDALGAKKGPGSIEYGEKWLDDYELIFDWNRTPKCAQQFEDMDYAVDSNGNTLSRLIDFDNDFIDATRYACERDMHGGAKLY